MTSVPARHLSESLNRVTSIDALRGLAALCVVLFHARGIFWVGFLDTYHRYGFQPNLNAWLGYLTEPFSYGFLGVNLFFVLSGYCIHRRGAQMLAKNPQARLNIKGFAARRFWRIYPTYFAALVLTALVDWCISGRQTVTETEQNNSLFVFVVSVLTLQGYLAPYFGDNGVFWTLAIEVHFYLVYPILFFLSRQYGPRKAVLFTLLVALAYIAADRWLGIESHMPNRSVQGPIFLPYWFTWAMGFYLAEIEAKRTKDFSDLTWCGLMSLGVLVGLPPELHGSHPEFADLFWSLFFTGLLRWSLGSQGSWFWNGWLGSAFAVVGVMSYSLYAIHNPALLILHTLVTNRYVYQFETIWPTIGGVLFALGCAWIFFQLVERWSLQSTTSSSSQPKGER